MMKEAVLHDYILHNISAQKSLAALLGVDGDSIFKHEDHSYPNSLISDFTLFDKKNNEVKAIIECKGSDIGVNDFVRGIGQVMQYQHFAEEKLSINSYKYEENACSVLCFPSGIVQNKQFNIGLFSYPEGCKIIELNEKNKNFRIITEKELQQMSEAYINGKVAISQYYVRDTRLYELYLCLRYCAFKRMQGFESINRNDAEYNFLRKLETQDNNNWRNAFISLSSLGLINSVNIPSTVGIQYANLSYPEFCYEIYNSYIKPYIDLFTEVSYKFVRKQKSENGCFVASNQEYSESIGSKYKNKEVLFVTDSNKRYISSWLNIMRDDFMCISFKPRSKERKINYNISTLNKSAFIENLRKNSMVEEYVKKYIDILKSSGGI